MKRKLKYFLFLLGLLAICPNLNVNAETYHETFTERYKPIPNTFVSKTKGSSTNYQQMFMMVRNSDNMFVYCIEPGVSLDGNAVYTGQDYDQSYVANMTQAQWRRIQLLAYYGYGYSDSQVDHTDLKWYAVTQFMIWQTAPNNYDIYFTDKLDGNRITRYTNEMAEMETLLSNHYITPDFGSTSFEATIGETLQLTDNNGVLSQYSVSDNSIVSSSQSGNTLYLTGNTIGNTTISLTKKDVKYSHSAIVYVKPGTQNVMQVGSYDPIDTLININIIGADIEIYKKDSETGSTAQGQATLKSALYGLYSLDGTLISELTTDESGYSLIEKVPLQKDTTYYIQEISPSEGYYLDNTKYSFTYRGEEKVSINVKEIVIKNYINLLKQFDFIDGNTTFLHPESGIIFEIYYPDGRLYDQITTDKNGYASIDMPFGTWRFHQKNTNEGFEKIYDFYITIDENSNKEQNYNILNNKLSAYLQVFKTDIDTNETIALANTTFKILNTDTNEFISQYVGGKVYDEFTTDEDGKFITYLKLEAGNYKLIEISSPNNYLINSDGLEFNIGNDTNYHYSSQGAFVTVYFKDKVIKGQIEIHKKGESLIIQNGNFAYDEIPLDNVTYNIYANEDILTADGKHLYYAKDQLVDTITTDRTGYALSKELYLGSYYLVEVKTKDTHVLDTKKYEFTLAEKDNRTPIVYHSYSALNMLKKGTLEFTKTDLSSGKEIPNTKVEIYHLNEDGSSELIFTGITDKNGKIIISDLFVGKFYIVETEANEGYKLSDEIVSFEIKEDGEIVKANMTNEKITSIIKIHKTDQDGNKLAGVEIGIFDLDGNLIESYVTDENGDVNIKLEYGSYYYQELKTIEGFVLNDEKIFFDVTEDGAIIESTLINIKVPNTLLSDYKVLDIVGIILVGVGCLVYAKKKK